MCICRRPALAWNDSLDRFRSRSSSSRLNRCCSRRPRRRRLLLANEIDKPWTKWDVEWNDLKFFIGHTFAACELWVCAQYIFDATHGPMNMFDWGNLCGASTVNCTTTIDGDKLNCRIKLQRTVWVRCNAMRMECSFGEMCHGPTTEFSRFLLLHFFFLQLAIAVERTQTKIKYKTCVELPNKCRGRMCSRARTRNTHNSFCVSHFCFASEQKFRTLKRTFLFSIIGVRASNCNTATRIARSTTNFRWRVVDASREVEQCTYALKRAQDSWNRLDEMLLRNQFRAIHVIQYSIVVIAMIGDDATKCVPKWVSLV